jgi:hypothetical protein
LPIALYTLILPWGLMFIIRYIKVNNYFKAAGCFALASIFYGAACNDYLVNNYGFFKSYSKKELKLEIK